MKKLVFLVCFLMVCGLAHAKAVTYDEIAPASGTSTAFHTPYTVQVAANSSSTIKLRNAISAKDGGNPTYGSGVNCKGWKRAIVYADLGGTSPGVVLRPLLGNDSTSTYFNGTDRTVSADEVFLVDVQGNNDFYVMIPEITGTTPTCTIYVTPAN